jgi:acetyl esterase/lipase
MWPPKSAKIPSGFSMVPVDGSRKLNEASKAAGGNVRYTEYPGVGHHSWDHAYAGLELMTWMLSKSV